MEFHLRQMERAAAPGGDEWIQRCLSLSPPFAMVGQVDLTALGFTVPSCSGSASGSCRFSSLSDEGFWADSSTCCSFVGPPSVSSAPPLDDALTDDVIATGSGKERSGRLISKRMVKSRRFESPSPLAKNKKGKGVKAPSLFNKEKRAPIKKLGFQNAHNSAKCMPMINSDNCDFFAASDVFCHPDHAELPFKCICTSSAGSSTSSAIGSSFSAKSWR